MPTKEETILSQFNEPFIKVEKYMITKLGLSGCQLLVYAIIRSFTAASGRFTGGISYFEKEYGFGHSTVCYAIKGLIDKGLIVKDYAEGRFTYTAVQKPNHSPKTEPQSKNKTQTVQNLDYNSPKMKLEQSKNRTTIRKDKKRIESVRNAHARERPSAEDAAAAILKAMEEGV